MTAQKQSNEKPSEVRAYVGLGSNAGDRVGFVQQAMQLLKDTDGIEIIECSSFYETEPDEQNGEWFVNAVAVIETGLTASELLDVCHDIEYRLVEFHGLESCESNGKSKTIKKRIIDMDILFYGDNIVDEDHLKIPHPSLHLRAFALVPLLEIAPDFEHPSLGKTIAEIHEALPEPEMVYLYGTRGLDLFGEETID